MDSAVLPCELLYLIIDAVDTSSSEGRRTLSTCSYANRALTVVCQKCIFQSVKIRYKSLLGKDGLWIFRDEETTTGDKFLDLLAGSLHIGSYVQNLTIKILPSGSTKSSAFSSESPSFSLYNIIPQLLNLKEFLIPSSNDHYVWSGLEERTRNFFITIIPLVTKLDFSSFSSFPVSKFSGCYNLQELRVFTLDNDVKEMIPTSREKVKLRSLEIRMSTLVQSPMSSWSNMTYSPLDISELRSLRLLPCLLSVPHIEESLALCSNALEDLDLLVNPYGNSQRPFTEQVVNLGSLRNLHHLTIRTPIRDQPTCIGEYHYHQPGIQENNDLLYIVRMLKTLPFHLLRPRQVRLDLVIRGVTCFCRSDTDLPLLPWSDLINLLDDNRLSSYFASVKLKIEQLNNNMALAALTRILDKNEGLKKLREKGILLYEPYDDPNYC